MSSGREPVTYEDWTSHPTRLTVIREEACDGPQKSDQHHNVYSQANTPAYIVRSTRETGSRNEEVECDQNTQGHDGGDTQDKE